MSRLLYRLSYFAGSDKGAGNILHCLECCQVEDSGMSRLLPARLLRVAIVAACLAVPALTVAAPPSLAVLELTVGRNPDPAAGNWSQVLEREFRDIHRVSLMDRSMVLARLGQLGVVPARHLSAERLAAIEDVVRVGEEQLYTEPSAAIEVLARALRDLEASAESLASQPRMRTLWLRAMMLLARAHLDAGQEDGALTVLREVVRVFGDDLQVTTRDYHPALVNAFTRTVKAMSGMRTASLAVSGPLDGCRARIDGRDIATSLPGTLTGLYPGPHFLQVRCGERQGLIRRIGTGDVPPPVIDMTFEHAVVHDGEHLGLVFQDAAEAGRLGVAFAARLGAMVGVQRVALHWRESGESGADAVLAMIDVESQVELGRFRVDSPTAGASREAARLLAQQALRDGGPAAGTAGGWRRNAGAWVLSSLGVAALVVGAVEGGLYFKYRADATRPYDLSVMTAEAIEPQFQKRKQAARNANVARIVGPVMLGVGAAALAGGIVWFLVDDQADRRSAGQAAGRDVRLAPFWAPDGGGLALSTRF